MLELVLSDADVSDKTIDKFIEFGTNQLIDRVCIPSFLITKFLESNPAIYLSAIISHPFGLTPAKTKIHELLNSWREGVKSVDFVINRYYLSNNKYNEILNELQACYAIAFERKMEFRVVIESNVVSVDDIGKLAEILLFVGINDVILSSSSNTIDVVDQIILANKIMKKTSLRVFGGPVWNTKQYEQLIQAKLYGIRFNSPYTFSTILKV
jgi:deoxyribose-phosphate aldolase